MRRAQAQGNNDSAHPVCDVITTTGKRMTNTKQLRQYLLLSLIGVLTVWFLVGCTDTAIGTSESAAPKKSQAEPADLPVPVEVIHPERRTMNAYFETTGRIVAENRVELLSKGVGQCVAVYVEEGDRVQKDQLLAELDNTELLAQINQTRVNVAQAKARLDLAERSLAEGIGPKVERDNAQFAYEQALATLKIQEVNLDHQRIRAPISGIITRKTIVPGMMVTTGMNLFSIVDPTSYVLPISVPERELTRLKEGQQARVTVDSAPDKELTASIRRINPSVDPQSGTIRVTLAFDDAAQEVLRDAAFCRVKLILETREDVLALPKDVILEDNARKYVMVVKAIVQEAKNPEASSGEVQSSPPGEREQNTAKQYIAERAEVQTGLEDSSYVEILDGLSEDAWVVSLGQQTLKAGARVKVTNIQEELLSRVSLSAEEALKVNAEASVLGGGQRQTERLLRRR